MSTSHSDTEKCDKSSADSFVTFLVGTSTTKYPIMTRSSPKRYSWQRSHDAGDDDDDDDDDGDDDDEQSRAKLGSKDKGR